jgi:uncharacterized membrane protein YjfL (UPF0719 family)
MENILLTGQKILISVPYFGALVLLLFVGKWVFNRTTKYNIDNELTHNDNPAFGITLASFFVGLAIALTGTLYGIGEHPVDDFISIGIYGALALALMRLSIVVNDKLILHQFCVHKEITQDKNCGTAFVVGGSCIATGFMISGALTGESISPIRGVVDLLIYWVVGQALLILGGFIFQKITSYDVHHVIEHDDNAAAGLSFGGFLVAIGIITKVSLTGATSNILTEIVTTAMLAVSGLVLLVAVRIITDRVILPSSPLCKEIAVDKNTAAGAIAASTFVCVALAYSFAVAS